MKRFALSMIACSALSVSLPALAQDWIPLQDGKSLAGWKAAERPESWQVEDGAFVSRGDRSHLFYVGNVARHNFKNFEFSADVMTSPGSNSGIYVHTKWQGPGWPAAGYELQVINSNPPPGTMDGYVEYKMTGSIYAVRNTYAPPAKDNEWFNYRIRVVGKTIQTFINDQLVCEYAEPAYPFRPADKKGRLLGSGTFALQAHDPGSVVKYRNMKVKILPADSKPPAGLVPIEDVEMEELVTQASNDNIPLIDFHSAAGLEPNEAREFRRHGAYAYNALPGVSGPIEHPLLIVGDSDAGPNVDLLKAAKVAGARILFARSGAGFDGVQFKKRLLAIKAAGLGWKDFFVPAAN